MGQSKEIKQKWKGSKKSYICSSLIFSCYCQSRISGMEIEHYALHPTKFEIFLIFPSFLRSYVRSRLATGSGALIQNLLSRCNLEI